VEKRGIDRRGEIRCERHLVYRRIDGGKEPVSMRDRRRDKEGEREEKYRREIEERQREIQMVKAEGVTEGGDRRRNGGKETNGNRGER
jgi:hypothetical protein